MTKENGLMIIDEHSSVMLLRKCGHWSSKDTTPFHPVCDTDRNKGEHKKWKKFFELTFCF
jgi:hypothetical protein